MKKHFLLIITLLFTALFLNTSLKSQTYKYHKLVDTAKVWSCAIQVVPDRPRRYSIKISDDTIIKGIKYKKLLEGDSTGLNWNKLPSGYIREDSEKKVYFVMFNPYYRDTTEKFYKESLIYDFGLNFKDTFKNIYKLDSIGNIKINNDLRKVYFFNNFYSYFDDIWIEGIGSVMFPVHKPLYDALGAKYNFICFKENDTVRYVTNNKLFADKCIWGGIYVDTKENFLSEKFHIYPNPATSELKINVGAYHDTPLSYKIFDIIGKVVGTQNFVSNDNIIDISKLTKGIYIIELTTKEGVVRSKFVKE